jgi:hypothetical protein
MCDVRQRIAMGLGIPLQSVHSMVLTMTGAGGSQGSVVSAELSMVSDLINIAGSSGVKILVENCHLLCPKASYDIVKILEHWMSPILSTKAAYRIATTTLRDFLIEVLHEPTSRHALNPAHANRVFARVSRGQELLKKLGMSVSSNAVYANAGLDTRPLQVALDHLTATAAAAVVPTTSPSRTHARSTTMGPRHRRLREFIDFSYENLLRFESIRIGLDAEVLNQLPLQEMTSHSMLGMVNSGHYDCGICLEQFAVGDVVIRLPCFHTFHQHCATTWLTTSKKCPNDMIEVSTDKPS